MKVTLEYDLEKQDDREEYMVITEAIFLKEVLNNIIKVAFDDADLGDDEARLKLIREKLQEYNTNN